MLSTIVAIVDYEKIWFRFSITPNKFILVIIMLLLLIIAYIFENLGRKILQNIKFKNNRNITPNRALFLLTLFFIIIEFYVKGNFKAGSIYISKFSILTNMISVKIIYLVCYFQNRKKFPVQTIGLSLFYILVQLYQGWTQIIIIIFINELAIFFLDKKYRMIKFNISYIMSFIIGAGIYKFIFPLKFYIRYGYVFTIDYFDALTKLLSRVYGFETNVYSLYKIENLIDLTRNLNTNFILEFFAGWIPRLAWIDKPIFFNLGLETERLRLGIGTLSNVNIGFLSHLVFYLKLNLISGIIYLILFIIYLILLALILKRYGNKLISEVIFASHLVVFIDVGKLSGISTLISTFTALFFINLIKKIKCRKY